MIELSETVMEKHVGVLKTFTPETIGTLKDDLTKVAKWYSSSSDASTPSVLKILRILRNFRTYPPRLGKKPVYRGVKSVPQELYGKALVRGRLKTGLRELQSWSTEFGVAYNFAGSGLVFRCLDTDVTEYGNTHWMLRALADFEKVIANVRVDLAAEGDHYKTGMWGEVVHLIKSVTHSAASYSSENEVFVYTKTPNEVLVLAANMYELHKKFPGGADKKAFALLNDPKNVR